MECRGPEEQLLKSAREGDFQQIQSLIQAKMNRELDLNINCRGGSKFNTRWTPLHLASYFGHKQVVEELLKAGADMNLQNDMGDTPLHKAALSNRKEIVLLLLRYDACATVINGSAQTPKDVTEDDEIITMLEAAQRREERKLEDRLLEAAREGDSATLTQLLSRKKPPDIHCRDLLGNTPLHCAAYRGQKQCVIKLLKSGAIPTMKNKNDQSVFDLANSDEIRLLLETSQEKTSAFTVQTFEGPLRKRSNFLGWRSHWVVLKDGVLSWYPKKSDADDDAHKQGHQPLMRAHCMFRAWDRYFFTVKCFDGNVHTFKVPAKTDPEALRKKWLDAIGEHSAWSTYHSGSEQACDEEDEINIEDDNGAVSLGDLTDSLMAAEASQQKLEAQVAIFVSMVKNEEDDKVAMPVLLKARETAHCSRETCSALRLCLDLLSQREEAWSLKLEQEVEKNKILSEALKNLATEHHELEQSLRRGRKSPTLSTLTEDDFYDAVSDSESERSLSGFLSVAGQSFDEEVERKSVQHSTAAATGHPKGHGRMSNGGNHGDEKGHCNGVKRHRTCLPTPMFSRNDVSIWSILKKCIGMELSKIAMPVALNEPLSFLQRLTEYMEHTYLIHQANTSTDSIERMTCVAAFAVSAVASQWERTGKPFNPLLGETYELIREDLGFRWMSEQVSHHPPVSAFHAEGLENDFVFHGTIYPKLKFWGKSVEAEPKGSITLELPKHKESYTWTNPTCCVHNIIVGQLWIEQYGNVEVINHKTGEKCCLSFKPCGIFGKELHKVEGYIYDKSKKKICAIYGKWTECLYTVDPATFDAHKKADKKNVEDKKSSKQNTVDEEPEEMPVPDAETVQVIPGSELIWRICPRPENSAQFYAFSTFAMQLNELEKEMEGVLPSTDCRLRPDIRAMENGDIDLASAEKKRLEEKQRAARKTRSKSNDDWKTSHPALGPRWFHQGPNPHNGAPDWLYSSGYWDRDYSQLPDIY
ncbi:oxysterol-binding protein-related protein 1-like isoform X2 [Alosa sapidissima]|uniref:oxysterol-binding protein-related protein 1-like isoform X2 n=1 Tax=Alosa sapidissima TaxID=34773 RepID=UPI001C0A1253|nr:oxysterol-binding protein-related protein 1-like isoform X2 [Alosa sapidissima]